MVFIVLKKSENVGMSEEFFERHIKRIVMENWPALCKNSNIPEEFFDKHVDLQNDINWYHLSENPGMSEEFFDRHIKLDNDNTSKGCKTNLNWMQLCRNKFRLDPIVMRKRLMADKTFSFDYWKMLV